MTKPYPFPEWEADGGRGIRVLTNPELTLLELLYPDLPASPKQCPTCKGTKTFRWWSYYVEPEPKRPKPVEYACQCEDQWITHRYLLYCGIGEAYQRYSWRDIGSELEDTAQYKSVLKYCKYADGYLSSGLGMIFYGVPGSGKSMLAYMVAKTLLSKGYTAYVTTFNDMVSKLMDAWYDQSAKEWFQHHIRNVGFLVIDDVGKEYMQKRYRKDDEAQGLIKNTVATADFAIETIVRHRVQNAKPTIITTNLDPDNIGARYDSGSIVDLIRESSFEHRFTNSNFRLNQRARLEDETESGLRRPLVIR